MSYKNKTYVAFDGKKDILYYNLMCAWKENKNIDFNFHNAHDIEEIKWAENKEYIKSILRERMSNTKQVIVLIGESTKHKRKYVGWEIDIAIKLNLPVICVYVGNNGEVDLSRCPLKLRDYAEAHIPFEAYKIKSELDNLST